MLKSVIVVILMIPLLLTAEEVTVYILDNGIRADHVYFKNVEIESVNLIDDFELGEELNASRLSGSETTKIPPVANHPAFFGDHATFIAGLVVDRAPDVKLVSVRTLDEDGRGRWSSFLKGVHWITNHHPKGTPAVVNLSLGGIPDIRIGNLITKAINDLVEDGVTIVVAAGNEGEEIAERIPSILESVISVGAVSFFNYRLLESNFGDYVDVYASGENLKGPGSESKRQRIRNSGTSVAAAVVTGHVAAHLSEHPAASPAEVKEWVFENSVEGRVKNLPRGWVETALLFRPR